jgi:hypothetical protein
MVDKTGNIQTGNIQTGNIQTGNIQTGKILKNQEGLSLKGQTFFPLFSFFPFKVYS